MDTVESSEEALLRLYGLSSNPFTGPWRDALAPRSPDEETRLYATVEGFGRALPEIKAWCENTRNSASQTCAYVLVQGPKGSGRTSTAHLIAYLVLKKGSSQAQDSGNSLTDLLRYSLLKVQITDDSPLKPVKDAVQSFYRRLLLSRIDVRARDTTLYDDVRLNVLDARELKQLGMYQDLMTRLFLIAQDKDRATRFVFLFEDIKNIDQINHLIDVTQDAVLNIFTTEDRQLLIAMRKKFDDGQLAGILVQLGEMNSDDIPVRIKQVAQLLREGVGHGRHRPA
jgi:hypothetical protein